MIVPALIATLRRVPLFTDLSQEELAVLAERATIREFAPGTVIFSEGDACHEFLVVQEGTVRTLKTAPNGRQQLIAIERVGSSLSEVPVFDGGSYPVSAQAIESTKLLRLDATIFRRTCEQHPQVALKVIRVLGHRLRHLSRLVEDLSFSTVRGRLIAHMIRMAEDQGRPAQSGVEFELTENNEELAARLGTVRELVSRNLGRLHGEGWIQMTRRTVKIADLRRLREENARTD